jgi:hypothetical protein
MCLNETHVIIGEYLLDEFPLNGFLKQEDSLSSFLFKFTSEHAIKKVLEKQYALELNVEHNFCSVLKLLTYWAKTEKH